MTKRSPREKAQNQIDDLGVGDMVFNYITGAKGAVMEIGNGLVSVDYIDGGTDNLPAAAFRRCRADGHDLDARKKP